MFDLHYLGVITGGPGSDKWRLMSGITYLYPGWACVGVGQMLRDHVARWKEDPEGYTDLSSEKVVMVHNLMRKGELVPQVRGGGEGKGRRLLL